MEISIFADHLLITLVTWVAGLILGSGLGYLMAKSIHPLLVARPDRRRILALLPWRTLLFILILFLWSPFLAIRLGLGTSTGIMIVGLTLILVAWFMTMNTFLDHWFPPALRLRLLASTRTLLFLALFTTLGASFVGGGGAGFYLLQQVNLLAYGQLLQGILLLGGIALGLDLIMGVVEYRAGLSKLTLSTL